MLGQVKIINGQKQIVPITGDISFGAPVDSVTEGNMKPVTSNAVYDAITPLTPVDSVTDGNSHPVTSNAVYDAITPLTPVDSVTDGNSHPVTSNAVYDAITPLTPVDSVTDGNMKPVTSNAVYDAISPITPIDSVTDGNSHPVTSNAVYDAITPLTPVNSVTQNDLHPVTSNAVASYIKSGDTRSPINDCNLAVSNGIWYFINAANCPPASIGFSAPDNSGSLYVQACTDQWINQICQDFYSDGTIFIRSRKNGTWTAWRKVKVDDSSNNIPVYTIPSSLIGSGSVTLSVTFPAVISLYVYISNPSYFYTGSIGITVTAGSPGTLTKTNIFGKSDLADMLQVTKNLTNNTITIAATWSSGPSTYNYTFTNLIVEGIGVNGFVV